MYVSFNDGESWQSFQQNLPIVPITDLTIKNEDLIVATQGRSFWIMDDISPLRQLTDEIQKKNFHLYQPRPTWRIGGGGRGDDLLSGKNLQSGVILYYYLKDAPDSNSVELKFFDEKNQFITSFKPKTKDRSAVIPIKKGLNRFIWDMRYKDAERFDGMILWAQGGLRGPLAVPGKYNAVLVNGKDSVSVPFEIVKDPRSSSSAEDLQAQFDFVIAGRNKLSETHNGIKQIRSIKKQLNDVNEKFKDQKNSESIKKEIDKTIKELTSIEEALYQTKNKSPQDPLNYPNRLNDKLASLVSDVANGDFRPTVQSIELKNELFNKIDEQLNKLKSVIDNRIPELNKLIKDADLPAIIVK